MPRELHGIWLGRRRYEPVHALQQRLLDARKAGTIGDTVLLLEHEPVITMGRGAAWQNLLVTRAGLDQRGVDFAETGRGGDVTLHAPGQLVCYPIVDLSPDRRDVRRYVGDLAECMRRIAAEHGIASGPVKDLVGLWTDAAAPARWNGPSEAQQLSKLGAIGVRISRWVTMHGFALNLSTDLALFSLIVPCGISQHGVTSIQALTGAAPAVREAAERALVILGEIFGAPELDFSEHVEEELDAIGPEPVGILELGG